MSNTKPFHLLWDPPTNESWWRHQMEAFSALLALYQGNSLVTGEFPSQRPVTRSLMFSLICSWTNGWVNNRDAGDLRRHHTHYDVVVMIFCDTPREYPWNEESRLLGQIRHLLRSVLQYPFMVEVVISAKYMALFQSTWHYFNVRAIISP